MLNRVYKLISQPVDICGQLFHGRNPAQNHTIRRIGSQELRVFSRTRLEPPAKKRTSKPTHVCLPLLASCWARCFATRPGSFPDLLVFAFGARMGACSTRRRTCGKYETLWDNMGTYTQNIRNSSNKHIKCNYDAEKALDQPTLMQVAPIFLPCLRSYVHSPNISGTWNGGTYLYKLYVRLM